MSARQDRITLALRDAMKARDKVAVGALRSVLGEIGNAEAVPVDGSSPSNSDGEETPFAGSVEGLGGGEADRRELTDADVISIVESAMAERLTASEEYRTLGRDDAADVLDAEVAVLRSVLD